jgi:UDP-N-acetylmuramoyl-tripeptide--D-alanyl-D-alanine ligase
MIESTLSELALKLNGQLIGNDAVVERVVTDSRADCTGALFVALRGPHFDAHKFIQQVSEQGAAAVVVETPSAINISQIVVADSKRALGELARINRNKLKAKFVAVTGSSGKTTVKEMITRIIESVAPTHATKGNLNNDIGAPLTLLEMDNRFEFGVIELGANHAGEIAYTANITQADVALINNVAAAHLQGFGDLQGVARAKSEIYAELKADGVAVINLDDDFAQGWLKQVSQKQLTFSANADPEIDKKADITANNIQLDSNQCPQFELAYKGQKCFVSLPLAGAHNVNNALAAAACCLALGLPLATIAEGLAHAPVVKGRLNTELLSNGCRVIDDSYNANLDSMRAAIDLLSQYKGRRVLVIGDMAELGEFGRQCHEELGVMAKAAKIDALYSCGVLTQFSQTAFNNDHVATQGELPRGKHFSEQIKLIQQLQQESQANTTILIKGSRSSHMEKVVNALKENCILDKTTSSDHKQSFALNKGEL